jgi:NTE family protein
VLEVLEELHIPIDCVAGTSMGALVAGAYAAGHVAGGDAQGELAEGRLERHVHRQSGFFGDQLPQQGNAPASFPVRKPAYQRTASAIQPGVVAGQKIKLFFNQLVRANQGERNIEKLPCRCRSSPPTSAPASAWFFAMAA